MEITHKPQYRLGKIFYAITEDDPPYLVHMGIDRTLRDYCQLSEEYGEDVYWCCMYENYIEIQCVFSVGNVKRLDGKYNYNGEELVLEEVEELLPAFVV